MMELNEYRADLLQSIKVGSVVNKDFKRSEFVNTVMDRLIEADEISDFTPCFYDGIIGNKGKRIEIDGYDFNEFDGTFSIVVCKYDGLTEPSSRLNKTEIEQLAERARRFVEGSFSREVQNSIEESEYAYELAEYTHGICEDIVRYKIFVISDLEKSDKIKSLEAGDIDSKNAVIKLWEISNLYDLEISKRGFDDIEIILEKFGVSGIPCIRACEKKDGIDYDAYLCAIPGKLLSDLYEKYGDRLLDSNVRSFLKLTTKTNKSIRATILKKPEMFFAYNNGITTTATDLILEEKQSGLIIKGFTSLQIVNGGQTTVTLNTVGKSRDKPDLTNIFVPMKISVISREKAEVEVPNISRSANTQNKVSESDFFSNSPFHKAMQEHSRKIRAPQASGASYATRWYYERTRGQYQQSVNMLPKAADVAKFKIENPKDQLFTKTDLAKYRNSFNQMPHIVSKGAQYSLIEFGKTIDEERMENYNELYFKESVALGILFKRVQDLVSEQSWYNGGYRAQIVTYSVAKLSNMIDTIGGSLDFMKIWSQQGISEALERQLLYIMAEVNECIMTEKEEENVGQWCKKPKCWEKVKHREIIEYPGFRACLVSKANVAFKQKTARRDQKGTNFMNALIEVVNYGSVFWQDAYEWGCQHDLLDGLQKSYLRSAFEIERKRPSDKQAVEIMKTLEHLRDGGYNR